MKIKRQKYFLHDQQFSLRCIQYNPACEQPSTQGLTNPYRRSTLPGCTSLKLPYPACRNTLSCVEAYDLLPHRFLALVRHRIICDHHFLSSSAFCRRTEFESQTGVERSFRRCSFIDIPWR